MEDTTYHKYQQNFDKITAEICEVLQVFVIETLDDFLTYFKDTQIMLC